MSNKVDMWHGGQFLGKMYYVDAYFSDIDCVYRGNIYDESGRAIVDYESNDSSWIEKNFRIRWLGE